MINIYRLLQIATEVLGPTEKENDDARILESRYKLAVASQSVGSGTDREKTGDSQPRRRETLQGMSKNFQR
jgi:hypothetical protein